MADRGAFETWLTLAVLVFLLPLFFKLVPLERGRDDRFDPLHVPALDMPAPLLPRMCAAYGARLPTADLRIICNKPDSTGAGTIGAAMSDIERQVSAIHSAFSLPIAVQSGRINGLLSKRAEGLGDLSEAGDEIVTIEAELRPFLDRYRLESTRKPYPRSLSCVERIYRKAISTSDSEEIRSSWAFWYAGILDGVDSSRLVDPSGSLAMAASGCSDFASIGQAADEARVVVKAAFESKSEAFKATAMRGLLSSAWWQYPVWAAVGLLFVKLARQPGPIVPRCGLVLMMWGGLAWVNRVYLKLLEDKHLGWNDRHAVVDWLPPTSVVLVIGFGLLMLLTALVRRWNNMPVRSSIGDAPDQVISSRVGYAGLVACLGIGWLVLLDLSAGAHPKNRFLGLYQQGIVWGGFFVVSLSAVLRPAVGRGMAMLIAWLSLRLRHVRERFRWSPVFVYAVVLLGMVLLFGFFLRNQRQLTSEVGRLWLIFGVAGFFFLRGEYVGDLRTKSDWGRFLGFLSPLLLVVGVLVVSMFVTEDMGPLLVSMYAAGVFLAAAVGARARQEGKTGATAFALGAVILVIWVLGLTAGLFSVGGYHSTVASRIESAVDPLGAINDQLAIITWFRESIPLSGYGIGAAPWCGRGASGACAGLPLQIQSDYTFTALAGVFGVAATGIFCASVFAWLWLLIRHHPRATSGRPDLGADGSVDTRQAFLSWIVAAWVALTLCQLAITIAGNVGVLPLTGVTFPFVSYGMMSLWFNAFFFGLGVNIDRQGGRP
jgi:cell division protein FtsW (lipid II flippase)